MSSPRNRTLVRRTKQSATAATSENQGLDNLLIDLECHKGLKSRRQSFLAPQSRSTFISRCGISSAERAPTRAPYQYAMLFNFRPLFVRERDPIRELIAFDYLNFQLLMIFSGS